MSTNMNELITRVRNVILDNRYLTMATCNGHSVWIAPLAYLVEPNYCFVYYSGKNSRHQEHVAKNPIVACSIYNSSLPSNDADGIQFTGKVSEVKAIELPNIMPKYLIQLFPMEEIRKNWYRPITDFKGFAVQRFYRIEPQDMFTLDFASSKVDKRVEVDLKMLRQIPITK